MEESGMKIGEVAKAAGIGIDAVRFYEREGLIRAPARRPSGYREYTPDIVVGVWVGNADNSPMQGVSGVSDVLTDGWSSS